MLLINYLIMICIIIAYYSMGSGASKPELVTPGEVFDKLDEEIKSGVEEILGTIHYQKAAQHYTACFTKFL